MTESHLSRAEVIDYVHGELSPSDDVRVHGHLSGCAPCSQTHQEEARLGQILRDHARAEERDLPPGVVARIREAVDRERPAPWWQQLAFLRPAAAFALAAAVIVIGYFGITNWHATLATTTIDAAYYLEDHAALAPTMPFGETSAIPATLTADDAVADEHSDVTP